MSQSNPYAPSTHLPVCDLQIRKVKVRPLDLLKRGYRMLGDQYWLFLGITIVGMIVGSAVPFGLILGPMLVGIYGCYAARERGETVEFAQLFRGFDSFKESFIAYLVVLAAAMVVMIPVMIAMFVIVILPIASSAAQNGGNGGPPPGFPIAILAFYPVIIILNIVIAIPFLFAFQLIADRNMRGIDAVKASVQGALKNLFGITWYMVVLTFISLILVCMCYVPVFFFFPVSFGAIFLLYRDIFPNPGSMQSFAPEN
ncbi:hypothetical protein [Rubripirellula reticaptiva]|uniref:DUF4013 domain-containing protein n=1 Tax=Rubripirellula reticaptiva TaxID=2528013 RepID=A0A5C6FCP5_9BACT|nr:hypothetical protein [Rubripirellula reticaptiva]TWU58074.1 hypothetical protein Poly59_09830 [Rubripirellula reticaptiva]